MAPEMTADRYFCHDRRRREAVREHPVLNGIDYLEVVDLDAPPGSPRQQTLLARCLKPVPAGLGADNVEITGGVRIAPVRVEWVGIAGDAAALAAAGRISAGERDFLLALPHGDRVLVVRTDVAGDFSTYRLRLVSGGGGADPLADFDALLADVEFSFKVECPSEFDCKPETACPEETPVEPLIDYLAKDYASFRQLILDRLAVIMPEWRERNPADLGIALVELLAYAGDRLSYYQDAAGAEAYLGTARRRSSVRRHARLLDYRMHDGVNARVWVQFEVGAGSDGAVLPRRDPVTGVLTRLLTRVPEPRVVSHQQIERIVSVHRPEVFELMHDVTLFQSHNAIRFYTWGDRECCLPRGATRATLRDDDTGPATRVRLRAGDVLILEERIDPGTGVAADADPARRHAVRLTRVEPEARLEPGGDRTPGDALRDPLSGEPIVEVEWDPADALPFPLCVSTDLDGHLIEDLSLAAGNAVLADHGRTIEAETLPAPDSFGHRRYRPQLGQTNVTYAVPAAGPEAGPASGALHQEPSAALPAVTLTGGGDTWEARRDLLDSDRFDLHFVVETEDDGRAFLRFARDDDEQGRTPERDLELRARYRVGTGVAGNVGAGAIGHACVSDTARLAGLRAVRNPLPARGGVDPESTERVRLDAPRAFRVQERAVTEEDYAEVSRRHPEVQRAVATRRWTGSWHTMFVTVDRLGGRPIDADFEDELRELLQCYRLAGHDVEIEPPIMVPLDLVMTVCVAPDYFKSDVEEALLETFSSRDFPDGRRGFFHPDNFTFGQPLYLSRVVAAAMQVPGVLWVDLTDRPDTQNRFRRWGERSRGEWELGRIDMGRLEIARADNDPNAAENGRIAFLMEGGS